MNIMRMPVPSEWPSETAWLPRAIYEAAGDSVNTIAPDAKIHIVDTDDDNGDEIEPAEPACGFIIRRTISKNRPSVWIGIRSQPHAVILNPRWLTFGASRGWYWQRSLKSDDDSRIVTDFKNELERWLDERIVVFYVFKGSKMVGCQVNDGDDVLWRSWRGWFGSKRDLLIVRNDPCGVDGFIQEHEFDCES